MRILLDEFLPIELHDELSGHAVRSVREMGWFGLKNGELLRCAAEQFDVFMTADQNLQYRQNLRILPVAVAVPV
ncbi:MAG TPA: DUF5615 family PIN-like protein, partial [Burkholderiales bacterium]|nr:DUF5615 family PIN-like protein [Burkholderiales bacterium]